MKNIKTQCYKLSGIIFLILFLNQLNAQEEIWYTDFSLSYFPKITSIKYSPEHLTGVVNKGEFNETLNILTKSIFGQDRKIQRFGGMRMMSGTAPKELNEAERWLQIRITDEGKISVIKIYNKSKPATDELSNLFIELFKTAKVNPAISNNQKVNCILYYLILKE